MTAVLVLGGARSGKSQYSERLVAETRRRKVYLATSEIWDDEMADRVAKHRIQRGDDWDLIEEPLDLTGVLEKHCDAKSSILVDCLTLWLTNLMMAEKDVNEASADVVSSLLRLPKEAHVCFVSNEVGQGIVPADKMSRDFRDHAGRLHQSLATVCDEVWFVTAGLPQKLK